MTGEDRDLLIELLRLARKLGWLHRKGVVYSGTGVEIRILPGVVGIVREGHATFFTPASVADAIEILAALQVIPSRFSTLGSRALVDHAEALRRLVEHKLDHVDRDPGEAEAYIMFAAGVNEASEAALATASRLRAPVAVRFDPVLI